MSTTEDRPELATYLERLPDTLLEHEALVRVLPRALQEGSQEPLMDWAHDMGASHARAEDEVEKAVKDAMAVGSALEGTSLNSQKGGPDDLGACLVTSAVQGYYGITIDSSGHSRLESLRGQVEELTALHRVISAANSSRKVNDLLQETANAVVAVTHADNCSIFLYEPEWDQLVLDASTDPNSPQGSVRLRLGEGITGWSAMAGIPVAVRDVHNDPRFKEYGISSVDAAKSMLAVPVVLFTIEKLVGVITIKTFEERDFSDTETKFLETVAGEIAIAIENARLYEQTDARLRQKVAELTALQGVSAHIAATLNLSEVLSLIAHQAAHLVHSDASTIYAINPDAGALEQVAHYNLKDPRHNIYEAKLGPRINLDLESSTIGKAVQRGIPVALPPNADEELGLTISQGKYKSMFCVPLVAPRGIMGAICLYDANERNFTDEQVHLLDAFGHEAAVAIENSRLYEAALRGLQIKSAMLQEMNHRVRNNLQTVAGLLSMQLRRLPQDADSAVGMRESIARIQSMAAIHDLMMGSDVLSTSVYEIAHKIAEAAVSTLLKPGFNLKLSIDHDQAEHIRVDSQKATLLALLINELLSNAILHGFAGRDAGELRVRAWTGRSEEDKQTGMQMPARKSAPVVNIEVLDNGSGLPEGFSVQHDANLGLSIVRTMVSSDLRGCFTIGPNPEGDGTRAVISFQNS